MAAGRAVARTGAATWGSFWEAGKTGKGPSDGEERRGARHTQTGPQAPWSAPWPHACGGRNEQRIGGRKGGGLETGQRVQQEG